MPALRLLLLLLAQAALAACAHGPPLGERQGQPFPELLVQDVLAVDPAAALGVKNGESFRLSEVPGDLLILEFFSSRCPTCQREAPELEQVFRASVSGPLAGRVRVLAVGAGDLRRDLEAFRRDQRITYPLVADPWYELYGQLGALPRPPVILFLRKQGGRWVQAGSAQGHVDAATLLARAQAILDGRIDAAGAGLAPAAKALDPPLGLDESQQRERALAFLSGIEPKTRGVEVLEGGGARLFLAVGEGGRPLGLYARIASREPPCDVCHAVHFLLAFDDAGVVRGFEPIHVSKIWNQPLTPEEAAKLRTRLVGRTLAGARFDPAVDSVTSATLSASVVFDEARRTAKLLSQVQGR